MRALIIEDDSFWSEHIAAVLHESPQIGSVLALTDTKDAWRNIPLHERSLVVADLSLGFRKGLEGLRFVTEAKQRRPLATIVVCSSHSNGEIIVRAISAGASDFLPKDLRLSDIKARLHRCVERVAGPSNFSDGVSQDFVLLEKLGIAGKAARHAAAHVRRVAAGSAKAIHVEGESGTGKESLARLVHAFRSGRGPFVPVNCGGIPTELVEREFFGSERGSYTGADGSHRGFIQQAAAGVLFLDEVGFLPEKAQVGLLRFLDSGEMRSVGGKRLQHVDLTIVSATNIALTDLVEAGRFRNDLAQRLLEASITTTPLRQRPEDIRDIATFLTREWPDAKEWLTEEVLATLESLPWKNGNVRELRNCLRAIGEQYHDGVVGIAAIPTWAWANMCSDRQSAKAPNEMDAGLPRQLRTVKGNYGGSPHLSIRELSSVTGIPRSTLHRRIVKDRTNKI